MRDKVLIELHQYEQFISLVKTALGFIDLLDTTGPIDTTFLSRCLEGCAGTLQRLQEELNQARLELEEELKNEEMNLQTQWEQAE